MEEPNSVTITIENPIVGKCDKCGKEIRSLDEKWRQDLGTMDMDFNQIGEPELYKFRCGDCGL